VVGARPLDQQADDVKCAPGEVHIWRIELDCAPSSLSVLEAMLTLEERNRAARFRSAQVGQRWTVARGTLRCILADYVESVPRSLLAASHPEVRDPGSETAPGGPRKATGSTMRGLPLQLNKSRA